MSCACSGPSRNDLLHAGDSGVDSALESGGTSGATGNGGSHAGVAGSGARAGSSSGGTASGGANATGGTAGGGAGGAASGGASATGGTAGNGAGGIASGGTGGAVAGGSAGATSGGSGGRPSSCDRPPAKCHCATHDDHDYLFCAVDAMRAAAEATCQSMGMHLIRVNGVAEELWMFDTAVSLSMTGDLWSGGMDQGTNDYAWPDGTRFWSGAADGMPVNDSYSHFRPSEPNGSGDCVVLQSDHRWDDQDCSWLRNYVCEAPGGSTAVGPYDCSMPAPLGCTCTAIDSRTYLFCSENLGFEVARVVCLSAGLHLVRLETSLEDRQVWTIASQIGMTGYFGDGNDLATAGQWQWSDASQTVFWSNGAAVNGAYVNWAPGEPNGSGDCLVIGSGPTWDDTDCVSHAYVCEAM